MRTRSLNVPGSDSSALHTKYLGPEAVATARHLRPVGNAAPPRPTSPDASISPITQSGPRAKARSKASNPPLRLYASRFEPAGAPIRLSNCRDEFPDCGTELSTGSASISELASTARSNSSADAGEGATTRQLGSSPAFVMSTAGARSHSPRHGLRTHPQPLPPSELPAGPRARSKLAQIDSAPLAWQAMSSQTLTRAGGRSESENMS